MKTHIKPFDKEEALQEAIAKAPMLNHSDEGAVSAYLKGREDEWKRIERELAKEEQEDMQESADSFRW